MTTLILQIVLSLFGLGATIFAWWVKNDADKKKRIADEDAKIDASNDADSLLKRFDELR